MADHDTAAEAAADPRLAGLRGQLCGALKVPYRRTGRPPGRPPKYPVTLTIQQLEAKAAELRRQARKRQAAADQKIVRLLAEGKTKQQVADELHSTVGHIRVAERRHNRRSAAESNHA